MTQNKFWLVWVYKCPEIPKQEFNSQEEALNGAKILAKTCVGKNVCVAETTHIIKGFVATQIMELDSKEIGFSINIDDKNNNVNGLLYPVDGGTDLSSPTETPTDFDKQCTPTENPKQEFKVGDHVIQDKCFNSIYRINWIDKKWVSMTPIYGGIVGTIFESQCSIERLSHFKKVILD
jgi:hypothetical protein